MRALLVAAILVGVAASIFLFVQSGSDFRTAVPPPIAPAEASSAAGEPRIPDGFLTADAKSARPVADQGLRWERAEGAALPTLISPCGGQLTSDADRVAGRQVALVADHLWKLERVVVYRDEPSARAAMTELRSSLDRCAEHPEGTGGVRTVWRWEALEIGDEAIFVAGQRQRDDRGLPGHHRGVILRQGRTLVQFVDFGQARTLADRSEVANYERDAAIMADKLRLAPWSR